MALSVETPDGAKDQTVTAEARAAFVRLLSDPTAFTRRAAEELLAVHNRDWHHYEQTLPLTTEQFQARLTLESVEVRSYGWVVACYEDGDLFWGHLVVVEQQPDGTFWEARFEG